MHKARAVFVLYFIFVYFQTWMIGRIHLHSKINSCRGSITEAT